MQRNHTSACSRKAAGFVRWWRKIRGRIGPEAQGTENRSKDRTMMTSRWILVDRVERPQIEGEYLNCVRSR